MADTLTKAEKNPPNRRKMKAATLFYGDEVASALTEEDESDFLTDLVRSVLKGERIEKIDSIFAVENDITASPIGSLTAISPMVVPVMTLDEWMASQGISNGRIRVQRRRKPVAAEDQMTLF
ncbi:MAG: hypothetical protein KJ638_11070 [Chloroflexi bacterium]|nr:hypothetical protein [Chloroflexota bacterium]